MRQSGVGSARHGHISKEGARLVRHVLGEAAWTVIRSPGPLRAFFARIAARKGPQVAATATARKLVVLFWHLLTSGEEYAFAQPSRTRLKVRQLELAAGDPPHKGRIGPDGPCKVPAAHRIAERSIGEQAEAAYQRLTADWQRQQRQGAGAATGERR